MSEQKDGGPAGDGNVREEGWKILAYAIGGAGVILVAAIFIMGLCTAFLAMRSH